MEYSTASDIKKRKLSDLITEKLLKQTTTLPTGEGGRPTTTKDYSVIDAVRASISEKTKAKVTSLKEKFDPLNIAKAMTGGSRLAPALLGRMLGRSQEDIDYFAGKGTSKGKRLAGKKDPNFTTIGDGTTPKLKIGDSYSNVLAKMFLFLKQTQEHDKLNYELEKNFREEQMFEDERRHNKLMDSILKKKVINKLEGTFKDFQKEKSPFAELLSGLTSSFGLILDKLKDGLLWVAGKLATLVASFSGGMLGGLTGSTIIKMITAAPLLPVLAGAIGGYLGIKAVESKKERQINYGGPEYQALREEEETRKSSGELTPEQEKSFDARQKENVDVWNQILYDNYFKQKGFEQKKDGAGYKYVRKQKTVAGKEKEIEPTKAEWNEAITVSLPIWEKFSASRPEFSVYQDDRKRQEEIKKIKERGDTPDPKALLKKLTSTSGAEKDSTVSFGEIPEETSSPEKTVAESSQTNKGGATLDKTASTSSGKVIPQATPTATSSKVVTQATPVETSGKVVTQATPKVSLQLPTPTNLPVQMAEDSSVTGTAGSNAPVVASSSTNVVGQNKSDFKMAQSINVRNSEPSFKKTIFDAVAVV